MLNRLWQAVNVCSARRAFTLLYQGHAQVVSSDQQNNFATHDFASWLDFSLGAPEAEARDGHDDLVEDPDSARHRAAAVRSAAEEGGKVYPPQRLRARQQYLPILRQGFRAERSQSRSRPPARQRRPNDLGKRRLLLHSLQYPQGQPAAASGAHGADPQTEAAEVAAFRAPDFQQPAA